MIKIIDTLNKENKDFIAAHLETLPKKLLSNQTYNTYISEQLDGYNRSETCLIINISSETNNIFIRLEKLNNASTLLNKKIFDINWIAFNSNEQLTSSLPQVLDYLKTQLKINLLIYKAHDNPTLHTILRQYGFEDYGENHTFLVEAPPVSGIPFTPEVTFLPGISGLDNAISRLVLKTYKHGHYFADPRIKHEKALQLMAEGILNLYRKTPSNFAFFYRKDKLLGFSGIEILHALNKHLAEPLAQMQFTIFDLNWDEKIFFPAIYSKKLEYFMELHSGQFVAEIYQDNKSAIKLVPQGATKIINRTRIFHLWL